VFSISSTTLQNNEYVDEHVKDGHQYEYRVSAINAAGNGTPSEPSHPFYARPLKRSCYF
jgi:hypothetical protein